MAMTVTKPADYTETVYDDVWLRAISSASGQTDLKYVVELYDSNNSVKLFEGKIVPEPSNKYMYFNVAPIIRNVFSEKYFNTNAIPSNAFKFEDEMQLEGKEYASIFYRIGTDYSGITTLNEASGFVNALWIRPKLLNRRWLKNSIQIDINNKWQTDRKLISSLTNNFDNFFIAFRNYLDAEYYTIPPKLGFVSYSYSGAILSQAENEWESSIDPPNDANYNAQLNIGPDAINRLIGTSPDLNICAYYDVYVKYTSDIDNIQRTLTFRINKHCENKYQSVPIHFLNRFHCYDTMRFDLVSRTTMDVERKSYNQRDYRFSGSSVLYTDASATGTTVFRENKINYNATYNYTMKLTSDFLDDQDWEWLEDLILSPKVYMEEDGFFYPVTIKATNYEISKYINNRLRPLEIEIEFNSPRLSSSR